MIIPLSLDLFGNPVDQRPRPMGRPRHEPTDQLRARVGELRAAGLDHVAIAAAIGITAPTLRRHYRNELRSQSRAWLKMKGNDDEEETHG